jgi:hypothetical protein
MALSARDWTKVNRVRRPAFRVNTKHHATKSSAGITMLGQKSAYFPELEPPRTAPKGRAAIAEGFLRANRRAGSSSYDSLADGTAEGPPVCVHPSTSAATVPIQMSGLIRSRRLHGLQVAIRPSQPHPPCGRARTPPKLRPHRVNRTRPEQPGAALFRRDEFSSQNGCFGGASPETAAGLPFVSHCALTTIRRSRILATEVGKR